MHYETKCPVVVAAILIFSIGCSEQKTQSEPFIGKPMEGFPASPESQVTRPNCTRPPYISWTLRNAGILPSLMVARGGDIHSFAKDPVPGLNGLLIEYKGQKKTFLEVNLILILVTSGCRIDIILWIVQ